MAGNGPPPSPTDSRSSRPSSPFYSVRPQRYPPISYAMPLGMNQLHKACLWGSRKSVAAILDSPTVMYDLNERVPLDSPLLGGYTPLLLAAALDREHIVKMLLEHGADPNAKTLEGVNSLHLAIETHHKQMMDFMADTFSDRVKDICAEGLERSMGINSPLVHPSVRKAQFHTTLRQLLAKGADINDSDEWGFTPLHRACNIYSPRSLIRFLLHSGANVNARSNSGATPLHVACEANFYKTAKFLIRYGAQVHAQTTDYRMTPLHLACIHRRRKIVKLLLKHGASLEARTSDGLMPLHVTLMAESSDQIVPLLLRRGAPVNYPGGEKMMTPLHVASMNCKILSVKFLLHAGADVNARCKGGNTPLHVNVKADYENREPSYYFTGVIDYLLRWGADVNARNAKGRTVLHLACRNNSMLTTRNLLEWGADLFAKDHFNKMPLDYCHPTKLAKYRGIFWPYVEKMRKLHGEAIGSDIWPPMQTSPFIERCIKDVRSMRNYKFTEKGPTLLDIATKSPAEMARYVTRGHLRMLEHVIFIEGKYSYPNYYILIGRKMQAIDEELRKSELVKSAKYAFKAVLGWHPPDNCVDKILNYLKADDLDMLIRAGDSPMAEFLRNMKNGPPPDKMKSKGLNRCNPPKQHYTWAMIDDPPDYSTRCWSLYCLM